MFRNYIVTAWRNLRKSKAHSFINITGLAVGMAVAMLIGLWVYDEVSFNRSFQHYNHIGQVWQFVKFGEEKSSYNSMPIPLAEELRSKYPEFEAVSVSTYTRDAVFGFADKKIAGTGNYAEPAFADMLSVKITEGSSNGLRDINSVMLSQSLAKKIFGNQSAINKILKIDNRQNVKVTAVYQDLQKNSSFQDVHFIAPWQLNLLMDENAKNGADVWDNNSYPIYVQLKEGADFKKVSAKIQDIRMKRDNPPAYKPEFFIHPMSRWHLYGDFKNGINTGGLIKFVWLFGVTGIFVLLLACINFMNLSTARSEKRAREVGIRKAIGSMRMQLIAQFFCESLLVTFIGFAISLVIIRLMLPFFNEIAGKQMLMFWDKPLFWIVAIAFTVFTGLIAGSYPAFYLSSFRPVKVLKGVFKAGRLAAVPRRVLVVLQFTVSVALIIGTVVVYRQVQHSRNRPVGYSRNGLIEVAMNTPDLYGHYNALRNDLISTGAVAEMSQSSGSVTVQYGGTTDISWPGKTADQHPLVMSNEITHDYGKTVGWQIVQGRDFSRSFRSDTAAVILNESAAKLMGFKQPIGQTIRCSGKNYQVIAVTKDMIKESPFDPVKPSFFLLNYKGVNVINIKLAPQLSVHEALLQVEEVFKKYNPSSPFNFNFVDDKYAEKFSNEVRIGKLAAFFAILAIFVSCLGLFGMASFMAEQRTKEIGVRKVLGASVYNLWQLLSKEFVALVLISFFIAAPVAYYFMHNWLQNYEYRADLSWWIFGVTGAGALLITLLTVSFQSIKAALMNPVKSLRSE
ncbi:ABC transporter permease [Foetidibacter luteolus]|uniref:ABC transporter permease n=1 Tax=Foetidibacter luteolus TaxID=2608880 RepID=UPI00129B7B7E|nr:ABC transporter permease [Foetidibacter luteolus]